jgi:Zn ribbon nucleic-acid-binding protein
VGTGLEVGQAICPQCGLKCGLKWIENAVQMADCPQCGPIAIPTGLTRDMRRVMREGQEGQQGPDQSPRPTRSPSPSPKGDCGC